MQEAAGDEHLRALFATFDADGSGTLDAEELLAVLTRGAGGLSLEDAKEIVNDFDDNKDGVLSVDEVCPHARGNLSTGRLRTTDCYRCSADVLLLLT